MNGNVFHETVRNLIGVCIDYYRGYALPLRLFTYGDNKIMKI